MRSNRLRGPFLFALLSAWPAFGQVSFTRTDPSIGQLAALNLVGDFNNDGFADVAVLTSSSASVYLGNGDGTFQSPKVMALPGNTPIFGAVGDLNHDGNQDILAGGGGNRSIVLLGNGDGTFQPPVSPPVFGTDIALGDLNGDGKPDLVTAGSGTISVALGNGDGTFATSFPYLLEISESGLLSFAVKPIVADVNGDGRPDVIAIDTSLKKISILLGNGDGTLRPPVTYAGVDDPNVFRGAVADVNGDGFPDVLLANLSGITLFLGKGDGTFQSVRTISAAIDSSGGFAIGDVNGDGVPDVVVAGSGANAAGFVSTLPGNGDGSFGSPISVPVGLGPKALAVVNVNGDLNLDMLTANSQNTTLLLNNYPKAIRVSPSSGGGISQSFGFTFSHPSGPAGILSSHMEIGTSTGASSACYIAYTRASNSISLADDQGNLQSPLTIGNAGTTQNSQCSINSGASSTTTSGKLLTVNLAITFQAAFAGAKNIYVEVSDGTRDSGWVRLGAWNVGSNLIPDFSISMTPANRQTVVAGASATYIVTTKSINGFNAVVTFQASGLPSGATASFNPTSVTGSGSTILTVQTIAATPIGTVTVTAAGLSSSLNHAASAPLSVTANNGPPVPLEASPTSGSGSSGTFVLVYYNPDGIGKIVSADVNFNTTTATTGACHISFIPAANTIALANDVGTLQAPLTVGAHGTTENTHCFVDAFGSSVYTFGDTVTLILAVQFKPSFSGGKNIYMKVSNGVQDSGWKQRGTFTVTSLTPPNDFTIDLSPGPGIVSAGSAATFKVTITGGSSFAGTVTFSAAGVSSGVTASFNPPTVTGSGSTTLTFNTTNLANPPSFSATITAKSGSLQHTATALLSITGTLEPPGPAGVTPSGGSGSSQTFAFAFFDPNGANDITSGQIDISPTLAVAHACYLYYVRASNALYLAGDAGAWQGPVTVGNTGTLQNSQCSVDSGASSVTSVGNTLTVTLALTFKPAFAGDKNVYMETRNAVQDSGWSYEGAFTVTVNPALAPAPLSVSPNSGTGISQIFALTFTDPLGATDITSAQVDINTSLMAVSSCYLFYVRGANAIYLANDQGAWQGPVTIGSASTLQNSQCSVAAGLSSAVASGNTLTLNLQLTFTPQFAGSKEVFMEVQSASQDSGWSFAGNWTVGNPPPQPGFSLGITAGPGTVVAGASPTYTVTVGSLNGFAGVVTFGVSGLPSGVTGSFNPTTVTGSGSSTLTLSTGGAASSNFTISVTGTSGAMQLNVTALLTITSAVGGGPPVPTSVSPNTGTGLSQTFAFTFTAPNGATDITSAQMDINAALAVANACYLFYVRSPNALYLASDAGVWQGPITLGGSGTLQNSQCSVNAAGSSAVPSGTTLTLNLALLFKAAFAGSKNVYMEVQNAAHDSGWSQEGTWTVGSGGQAASPPTPLSVTPNTGTGTNHTFAFAFSDPNGATDIVSAQMDINATLAVPSACYLFYVRAANTIYLASDTGVWQGPLTIGSAGTLQNSQCSVNSAASTVTAVGNTLTVNLALTFKAAFTGSKNIYMEVRDATHDSGWSLEGSWTP